MEEGKVVAVVHMPNMRALFKEGRGEVRGYRPVVALFWESGASELRVLDQGGGPDPFYNPEKVEGFAGWSSD
jgi:hypothetical protein